MYNVASISSEQARSDCSLSVNDSKFLNNVASKIGGAMTIEYVNTTITSSEFIGNTAEGCGGAMHLTALLLNLITIEVRNNSAFQGGSMCIMTYPMNATVIESIFIVVMMPFREDFCMHLRNLHYICIVFTSYLIQRT